MKKNIFIVVLISILFSLGSKIEALTYGGCEYSKISRLKSIVSNINLSYDYYINDNRAYYNITLNNLVPEIYFVDVENEKTYTYNNTINGEITIYGNKYNEGAYNFYSNLDECKDIKLGTKYYKLSKYNIYHGSNLCEGIENYSLCKKWANVTYSMYQLENLIENYKNGEIIQEDNNKQEIIYEKSVLDYIIGFYVKYYYFILIGIIVICTIIMIISRKRNKFDL